MAGKPVLVAGARNKWSLAWHAAQSLMREGARVAFSVKGEREAGALAKVVQDSGVDAPILECDATQDAEVERLFAQLATVFDGRLHGLVHSIAFADTNELRGEFLTTSRGGFTLAHEASVYTLVSLCRGARRLMRVDGGAIVTLTYLGSERVVPNYNAMGAAKASLEASVRYLAADLGPDRIRVNAVSAGAIKTLSAAGIAGFDTMARHAAETAPLRRGIDAGEVGDAILFLLSDWARGITGEVLHVDAGYHIMGMC